MIIFNHPAPDTQILSEVDDDLQFEIQQSTKQTKNRMTHAIHVWYGWFLFLW